MTPRIILAIVAKDLRAFARDRLWLVLTPVSIAFAVAGFWLAPATVDDTLHIGICPPSAQALMVALDEYEQGDDDNVVFVPFDEAERLEQAIAGDLDEPTPAEDEVSLGLVFPEDFAAAVGEGTPVVTMLVASSVPIEIQRAFASEVREIAYGIEALVAGTDPVLAFPAEIPDSEHMILGEDRAGNPVPMRDKVRPMLAVLILMVGSIGIAGLVATEIEKRTVTAMLVTPARTADVLVAKAVTGTLLGSIQALAFVLITWSFGAHPLLVIALVLMGALMMAALGLIAGSAGRDFMSTMFLSIAFVIPMVVPTFSALFPGTPALWVRVLPTHGFVEALVGLLGYGRSPAEMALPIGLTVAWTGVLLAVALVVLRRRVEAS